MDFNLSEDQLAFQQAARDFARGELEPKAELWDAEKIFPVEVIKAAGELGFCGIYSPEKWGGLGLSRLDTVIIMEELARGCTSTAAFISIHNMATWMVCNWGTDALCEQWAAQLTSGQQLASYCLTEPNAGSDAGSLRTTAKKQGDEYLVNGSKMFISGAGGTQMLVVMTRTGSMEDGARGITAFAIPADADGIVYGKNEHKMGWNSQPTRTVTFENVKVTESHRLGKEGEGFKIAMKGLDGGRINIASCSLGAAQSCLTLSGQYLQDRQQFGQALSEFQALQFRLADMATELVAARQMIYMAASRVDENHSDKTTYCAMAKRFATDVGFKVCNEALQLHGGYGYLKEYPIERYVRDTRVHQILEGTNEIMRVITARRLLQEGGTEDIR
jgi:alkylation response protein AidB-like acyl-CoA dehydrogenase